MTGRGMKRSALLSGVTACAVLVAAAAIVSAGRAPASAQPETVATEATDADHGASEHLAGAEPGSADQPQGVTARAADPASADLEGAATQPEGMSIASRWCPPLTAISGDMEALRCWLTLTAGEMDLDLPLNFGDLPAWSQIDADGIETALVAYEEALAEQRRIEEEAAARERDRVTSQTPPAAEPRVQLALDEAGLRHQCHTEQIPAACNALFDMLAAGGTYDGGGSGQPAESAPAPPSGEELEEIDWTSDENMAAAERERAADRAELQRRIDECPNGGFGRYEHYSSSGTTYYVICH